MRTGTTLPELLLVLLLTGLTASLALSGLRSVTDRAGVRAAREEVLAEIHRTRMEARSLGTALLRIEEPGLIRAEGPGGEALRLLDLAERGVEVEVAGARSVAELRYRSRGTASFAATTLVFRRGTAEVRLVISSTGRVRR